MKKLLQKWLGLDYIVCQEQFHDEIKQIKQQIIDLNIEDRYHGLLHGEGKVVGLIELYAILLKTNKKVDERYEAYLSDLSELLAFDNKLEKAMVKSIRRRNEKIITEIKELRD